MAQMEYIIRQTGPNEYEVAKFPSMEGGEQPLAVYNVMYNEARQSGRCNCPAGAYRGTGSNDKHVVMVRQWIAAGRPLQSVLADSGTTPKKAKLKDK